MPVLIIATPRSGTNNTAKYYRTLGLKVTHEKLGAEGEKIDMAVDYHQLDKLDDWPVAIYLSREPIKNVRSLGGLLKRKGQYRRTLNLFGDLPHGLDPLLLACHYWLHCFRTCRHLPHLKAESMPRLDQTVNTDHQEGSAGIPEPLLGEILEAGRELGYYSRGLLLP